MGFFACSGCRFFLDGPRWQQGRQNPFAFADPVKPEVQVNLRGELQRAVTHQPRHNFDGLLPGDEAAEGVAQGVVVGAPTAAIYQGDRRFLAVALKASVVQAVRK
jgi:hypothetical protein